MHRAAVLQRAVLAAGLAWCAVPGLPAAAPVCFTAADNARLSFQVIRNAPAPVAGKDAGYAHYPLTGVASMQLGAVVAARGAYATYYFQWANRANAPLANAAGDPIERKANLQPGKAGVRRQRSRFTGVAAANACTMAQTASVLGQPRKAKAFARDGGVRLVDETAAPDSGALATDDTCVVPHGTLRKSHAGVLIDYEVQDGRTPVQTAAFLAAWAALVHGAGRKAVLLTNPLDAPTQSYTGIDASNAHALVDAFDLTTILLWSRNPAHDLAASYRTQKQMIAQGGAFDGRRVLIDFELAGTSLDDARFVRRTILADHLAGVFFWRNGATEGGACSAPVNARIAAVALGEPTTGGEHAL